MIAPSAHFLILCKSEKNTQNCIDNIAILIYNKHVRTKQTSDHTGGNENEAYTEEHKRRITEI